MTIGNDAGGNKSDAVQLLASDQINDNVLVTLLSSGWLDLNNNDETFGAGTSGTVIGGSGGLTLIMATGSSFSSVVSTGSGTLSLGGNATTTAMSRPMSPAAAS